MGSPLGFLVLTRLRFSIIDEAELEAIGRDASRVLSQVNGFRSTSLWESLHDEFNFLLIGHYESRDAMVAAWEKLAESGVYERAEAILAQPADMLPFYPRSAHGLRLDDTQPGHFLSLSLRIAEPGHGEDLGEELDRIFDEISSLPGYLGSVTGVHEETPDEIAGIVFWNDRKGYDLSLPAKSMYRVALYQRIL